MEVQAAGLNWSSERYLLRELVGSGGMSQVYRAWDRQLDREVAVKVLHPHLAASADSRKRFSREARAVAKLRHPHILEIFDFSGDSEGAYIVTEFIDGTTLGRFAQDVGFGLPQLGALAAHSLCLALEHAHMAGIVHRDLKPENVMVSRKGVLKLMDFGIARFLDQGDRMTMTGAMVGSPAYMAPEVIEGKETDARSDLFSLGTLIYWLLTGVLPFEASNTSALLKRVLDAEYRDPRLVAPAISDSLAAIVASLLMRDPAARPQTAAAVREALAQALAEDGIADPESELKSFLAEPAAYRARFRATLLTRLRTQAQVALRERRRVAAVKLADRVLALEPDDLETRHILDSVSARNRRQKQIRILIGAAFGLLGTAGIALLGEYVWTHRAPPAVVAISNFATESLAQSGAPPSASVQNTETSSAEPAPPRAQLPPTARTNPAFRPGARLGRPIPPTPNPANAKTYDQNIVVGTWADIFVDGSPEPAMRGVKSATLPLTAGRHTLIFSATGRERQTRIVDINPLKNPDIRLALPPSPAKLMVHADPPDANVMVNNQPYGLARQGPFSIKLEESNLTPTMDVNVFKNGYKPFQQAIRLRAGEPTEINVTLQPRVGGQ